MYTETVYGKQMNIIYIYNSIYIEFIYNIYNTYRTKVRYIRYGTHNTRYNNIFYNIIKTSLKITYINVAFHTISKLYKYGYVRLMYNI